MTTKRLLLALAVAGVAVLFVLVLFDARRVDACAEQLRLAATAGDRAQLESMLEGPAAVQRLSGGGSVELAFARPMDRQWSRVGLIVTRTATVSELAVFLLEIEALPRCRFINDYESGAFGR